MTVRRVTLRPSVPSGALASLLAVGVVLSLGGGDAVRTGLAIQVGGLLAVGIGLVGYRRGHRISGAAVAVAGGCVAAAAVGVFVSGSDSLSETLRFVTGFLGLPLLAAAVLPLRGRGSRTLAKLGAGGVFLCVVVSGLFQAVGVTNLLLATVATIIAWDAAENAVSIGEQLGRGATAWRLEATHTVGSALVGLAGVAGIHFTQGVAGGNLSLTAFTLMFVALLLFAAAMHR